MRNRRSWQVVAVALCATASLPVQAKPEYVETLQKAYPVKPGTPLEEAGCGTCHVAAGPPGRNAFGDTVRAVLEAAGAKSLTEALLKQAEATDSDGDGWSNGDEIAAGLLPGDAKSHPAAATTAPAEPAPTAAPKPSLPVAPPKTRPATTAGKKAAAPKPRPAPPAAPSPAAGVTAPATNTQPPVPPEAKATPAAPRAPKAIVTPPQEPPRAAPSAPPTLAPAAPRERSRIARLFDRLVPRHSFHPTIVHFPIALFLFGGVCELLGAWKRRVLLRTTGALNMTAACITSLGAVATGFLAMWRSGFALSGVLLIHLLLAVAATACMGATALVGWSFTKPHQERTSMIYWLLLAASLLLVGATGHFGGELVYGS